MNALDAILLVVQALSTTFAAVLLLAGIVVFQNTGETANLKEPSTGWPAFRDLYRGMTWAGIMAIANIFLHWKENAVGRRCLYGSALAFAIHFGTYLFD